ncbi:MAG TPA: glycosyltransferase, partial [Myxococcales bacterium]|nr:glycosyltransferase [Myxococcales bacterium]
MAQHATVVIPCFNEARRLPAEQVQALGQVPGIRLLLVDDGSTDGTPLLLERICRALPGRARVLQLEQNHGKAEAVRIGLLEGLDSGSDFVAYLDADFATPGDEMVRLLGFLRDGRVQVALGARVALLGANIERKPSRHYLGRFFATFASLILRLPVYDTQCGAKAFRASAALARALEKPFHARWAFDVELIGRLLAGGLTPNDFVEVPLRRWADVRGSRLRPVHFPILGFELIRIFFALSRLRAGSAHAPLLEAGTPRVANVHE